MQEWVDVFPVRRRLALICTSTARRVKCDEARPACLKCTAGGWACVYSEGKEVLQFVNASPNSGRSASRAQLRALQFYIEKTVGQLTTFFPDELWDTIVLQLSHTEPCIQHALSALASYHELFTNATGRLGWDPPFGIQQYNAAIKLLRASAGSSAAMDVNLVSVPIFFCIEALRGNHESAFGLLQCGMQLVGEGRRRERCGNGASPGQYIMRVVEGLLSRLTIHATSFIEGKARGAPLPSSEPLPSNATLSFASLAEAREFLVVHVVRYLNMDREERHEPHHYIRLLGEWSTALDFFLQSREGAAFTTADKRAISLLKLYERYCVLKLQPKSYQSYPGLAESPTICDRELMELVDLAASALDVEAKDDDDSMQPLGRPIFHLEVGVTWILFTLLSQCQDPAVQRKILTIVPHGLLQEGLWSSTFTSRIGERILAMTQANGEKSVTISSLTETADIKVKGIDFSLENKHVSVVFRSTGNDARWLEHIPL
ncbi:hypothetical protein GQ53DRAFT_850045 [Thozetella sp. PMI_491]|nr:hypothetical protein GQ53DRAFT_850045 [Thozetella sp. PMI_491]